MRERRTKEMVDLEAKRRTKFLQEHKLEFDLAFGGEDNGKELIENLLAENAGKSLRRVKSAEPYFFILWLAKMGIRISAGELHNLMDIPRSTAIKIQNRLAKLPLSFSNVDKQFANEQSFEVSCAEPLTRGAALENEGNVVPALKPKENELDDNQKKVFELLSEKPTSFEMLFQNSGLLIGQLNASLAILELYNLIDRLPGEHYRRRSVNIGEPAGRQTSDTRPKNGKRTSVRASADDSTIITIRIARGGTSEIQIEPVRDERGGG